MKTKLLLLSTAFILTFSPMFAKSSIENIKADVSGSATTGTKITLADVQDYMWQYQIQIVGYATITGSENVYARDIKGITYIVYVQAGIITGWDESNF
jgi:hypothetical protein